MTLLAFNSLLLYKDKNVTCKSVNMQFSHKTQHNFLLLNEHEERGNVTIDCFGEFNDDNIKTLS